jgi:hypothetical protein
MTPWAETMAILGYIEGGSVVEMKDRLDSRNKGNFINKI